MPPKGSRKKVDTNKTAKNSGDTGQNSPGKNSSGPSNNKQNSRTFYNSNLTTYLQPESTTEKSPHIIKGGVKRSQRLKEKAEKQSNELHNHPEKSKKSDECEKSVKSPPPTKTQKQTLWQSGHPRISLWQY